MELIKVAIADDNENMIRMLTDLVSRDSELHVVGTAKNGEAKYRASYCPTHKNVHLIT